MVAECTGDRPGFRYIVATCVDGCLDRQHQAAHLIHESQRSSEAPVCCTGVTGLQSCCKLAAKRGGPLVDLCATRGMKGSAQSRSSAFSG